MSVTRTDPGRSAGDSAFNWWRRRWPLLVGSVVVVAGLWVPRILDDPYQTGLAIDGLLLGMVALAVGFLIRACGLVSIGHAAFFGGAAYVVAIGTTTWGWQPTVAVLAALAATTTFALIVGALVMRVTGISFAVITLAIGQALYLLSVQPKLRGLTNGRDGLSVGYDGQILGWGPGEFGNVETFWPLAWIGLAASAGLLWAILRSPWGLTLEAIRENEERARFSGISTFAPRLAAFVVSSVVASVAGVLFALHNAFVAPDLLHWTASADSLVAAIVGGVASVAGPAIGALLYVFARDRFADSGDLQLYTGLALVAMMILAPQGPTRLVGALVRRVAARSER